MTVYTTGQACRFCRVAPRTICKWSDKGYFALHRLPDSTDRRIHGDSLRAFMVERGIPTDLIDAHEKRVANHA